MLIIIFVLNFTTDNIKKQQWLAHIDFNWAWYAKTDLAFLAITLLLLTKPILW